MLESRTFDENGIVFVWFLSHDKRPVHYYTNDIYNTLEEVLAVERLSNTLRSKIENARLGKEIDVCYYSMHNRLMLRRLSADEIKLLNESSRIHKTLTDVNAKIYAATKDLQSQKKTIEKEYKGIKEALESKHLTHRF